MVYLGWNFEMGINASRLLETRFWDGGIADIWRKMGGVISIRFLWGYFGRFEVRSEAVR